MINSAKEATSVNDFANAKYVVAVAKSDWELGEVENPSTFEAYAESKLQDAGYKTSGNGGLHVSKLGILTTIFEDSAGEQVLIPKGFVASRAKGENTVAGGLVIYEGLGEVNDKNVVEARKTRNQFVWVPVEVDNDGFELINWREEWDFEDHHKSFNPKSKIEEEYLAVYESVKQNSGFYIARYEAGKEGTTAVSKKDATIWTAVTWEEAKELCGSVFSESTVVHLIYGEQWDAALSFISKEVEEYPLNSLGKGNFSNAIAVAGSNINYAVNNIYDMAGNVSEWTMEYDENDEYEDDVYDTRYYRGADYNDTDLDCYAAKREVDGQEDSGAIFLGFRMALYLK